MPTSNQISQMLDRYWEGASTLEEERTLKDYFQRPDYDPQFKSVAPIFVAIRQEQGIVYDRPIIRPIQNRRYQWAIAAAFLVLLSAAGWWWTQQQDNSPELPRMAQQAPTVAPEKIKVEMPAPEVKAQPEIAVASVPHRTKRIFRKRPQPVSEATVETEEAETAKQEIMAAFALISSKLSKGRKEAERGLKEVEHMEIIKPLPAKGG